MKFTKSALSILVGDTFNVCDAGAVEVVSDKRCGVKYALM